MSERRWAGEGLLAVAAWIAIAALASHAWVNARAAADYRAAGVPPFESRWQARLLIVGVVPPELSREAGLAPGDRIVRIGGAPVDDSPRWRHPLLWRVNGRPLRRGQRLALTVVRDGAGRELTVPLGGIPRSQSRAVRRVQAMMLPKQAAGLCLWLLGVLVLLRRRTAVTRVFFLWCMALALYTASSAVATPLWDCYPPGLILLFRIGFSAGWFLSPALFGQFCRVYVTAGGECSPEAVGCGHGEAERQGVVSQLLPWAFYPLPLLALLVTTVPALSQPLIGSYGRLFWVSLEFGWLATLGLGLATLVRARGRTTDPVHRKQIEFVLAGSLAYIGVFLHAFVTVLAGWDVGPDAAWAWVPHVLLPVTPLAFAYAILRHRLLDLDLVVRRSLVYTLLTLCMAAVFIVLQQLVGAALQAKTGATSLPAQTLAALAVAALFGPTERWLACLVEAVLNRRQTWRIEQLRRLGREIGFLDDSDRLRRVLVERLAEVMTAESVTLHWLDADRREYRLIEQYGPSGAPAPACDFSKNGGLAVWLALDGVPLELPVLQRDENYRRLEAGEKERLAALGAALCVPLAVRGQLAGFLTLGAKQDRDLFSPAEKEALLAVAALAAAALQQAEMARRLRELERDRAALVDRLQQVLDYTPLTRRAGPAARRGSVRGKGHQAL